MKRLVAIFLVALISMSSLTIMVNGKAASNVDAHLSRSTNDQTNVCGSNLDGMIPPLVIKGKTTNGEEKAENPTKGNYSSSPSENDGNLTETESSHQKAEVVPSASYSRHVMCKDKDGSWNPVNPGTVFSQNDEKAMCLMTVTVNNKIESKYYYRKDSSKGWDYRTNAISLVDPGSYYVAHSLKIKGYWAGSNYPRGWMVEVYLDDSYSFSEFFEVTDGGLTKHAMCEDVSGGNPVNVKSTFIIGVDTKAHHYVRLDHVAYYNDDNSHCHDGKTIWYAPDGSVYRTYTFHWNDYKDKDPTYDYWSWTYTGNDKISIDSSTPKGDWKVEFFLDKYYKNGWKWYGPIATTSFEIKAQPVEKPDLIVDDIWVVPDPPYADQPFDVHARICNIGDGDVTDVFPVAVFIDSEPNPRLTWIVSALGAGQCVEVSDTIHGTLPAGFHTVRFVADYLDYIDESREDNNERQETYEWVPSVGEPDIWVDPSSLVFDPPQSATSATVCAYTTSETSDKIPGMVIVGYYSSDFVGCAAVNATIASYGGEIIEMDRVLNFTAVQVSPDDTDELITYMCNQSFVRYAEQSVYVYATLTPNDPKYSQQWGPQKIKAPAAWDVELGESSVTVAIVDTGVDYNHEDLLDRFGSGKGIDIVNGDNDPMPNPAIDGDDHGTHVAGILAATINNGKGIAGLAQVTLLAVKVLNGRTGDVLDEVAGIRWAADNGADIISISLTSGSLSTLRDACEYAWNKGVIIIAASGNDDVRGVRYPAAYSTVVAVGAIDQSDQRCSYPGWWGSNYGPELELAAPGHAILSTVLNNRYESWDGTSMATPHVSGVAALVSSRNLALTNQQVREILDNTADDLGDPDRDEYFGYGRVDAQEAVASAVLSQEITVGNNGDADLHVFSISSNQPWLSASPQSFTVAPGGTQTVTVTVDPAGKNPGTYVGQLNINSDDHDENPFPVDVTLIIKDVNPPETEITGGPSGTINYNDVSFGWTGSDDVTPTSSLLYSYYLVGYDPGWSPWTSDTSKQYYDLPDNNYIFKVKAKDQADNIDPTPAERPFTVDTTRPTIIDHTPTGTDVPVTTTITVTFSETMNQASAQNAFSITPSVSGSFSPWSGNTMTFTPDSDLAYATTYTVTIDTGAMDSAGNPLQSPHSWQFTTTTPNQPPSILDIYPDLESQYQGSTIRIYCDSYDPETSESDLICKIWIRPTGDAWVVSDQTMSWDGNNHYYDWDIPPSAKPGYYDVNCSVFDGELSDERTDYNEFQVLETYTVTIKAYCITQEADVYVSFTWDETPYTTPETLVDLTGSHQVVIAEEDEHGHPFVKWLKDGIAYDHAIAIEISEGGVYTAIYAAPTILYVDPSSTTRNIGETLSINVSIADVVDLYGYDIKFYYDTTILDGIDVELPPDHFLKPESPGNLFIAELTVIDDFNATHGCVWVAVTFMGDELGKSGSGTLFRITFTATTEGVSLLNLDEAYNVLINSNAEPIPHSTEDGQVSVASKSFAHIYIEHTWIGDLVVTVGVGDPSAPLWSEIIWNREGGSQDNLELTVDLSDAVAYLPPSDTYRWYLKVYDAANYDQGRIVWFNVTHQDITYSSDDTPVPIYDLQTSYAYIPPLPVPTSYADIYIEHTWIGDLVVTIGVGDPSSPLWSQIVSNREGGNADLIDLTVDLSDAVAYLPPSDTNRWYLQVYDAAGQDQGQIIWFNVTHQDITYSSDDTPVPINDLETSYAYIPSGNIFEGSISTGELRLYSFAVPEGATKIEVQLQMPDGTDFDLSLWDDLDRRTGGWIPGDGVQRTDIPNSGYSGWLTSPELITVESPATSGTWQVACYAYSGSGTYKITVTITPPPKEKIHVFDYPISVGELRIHSFTVPADAIGIVVQLEMPGGTDFDLSLWDDLDRRTGGWIPGDPTQRTDVPNSQYSGWLTSPELIVVTLPTTSGTWTVGVYAYSGSGAYKITVRVYLP